MGRDFTRFDLSCLKKLAKEGLISLDNLEKTGNRTKAIYKITTAGRIEFKKLLRESLREKSVVLPSMLYMGLSFIRELPLEERLETLIEQKKELEKNFTVLKLGLKTKEQYGQLDEVTKLQFENLFAHYELQINFLNKLIEILPNQKNLPTDKIDEYFKATLDN